MSLDKSWINWGTRCSVQYFAKLDEFLDFAYANKDVGSSIYCPCRKCQNRQFFGRESVRKHLRENGFWVMYKMWTKHGEVIDRFEKPMQVDEVLSGSDGYMDVEMVRLVEEAIGTTNIPTTEGENGAGESEGANSGPTESTKQFLKLMQGANNPLYPGSKKHTTLSFVVRILQAKSLHGWTDTSFKELLDIFNETMPEGVNLPKSYYEAKKLVDDLGFTCKIVDACPNSCMLFRHEDVDLDHCLICLASRWKERGGGSGSGKRRAAKQARYFPLKPRLQRLFATSDSATLMKWHGEKREDDGVFRHPADSPAWKHLDTTHPSFGADIRNVRLGIASDGFNPFGTQTLNHSTWPVVLVPYNLPPMCILKQPYIYLSVLIDGPKGPGDKMDVYLQPLIEELKELWEEGVETFDASANQMFQMRVALLWTINDFPAYANLSGWSTKGEYACPNCNTSPRSRWLKHGRKWSYGSSRRFLPYNHKYRKDRKSFYDKKVEYDGPPPTMNGVQKLSQLPTMNGGSIAAAGHPCSSSETSAAARSASSLESPSDSVERQMIVSKGNSRGFPGWNTGVKVKVQFDGYFQTIGTNAARLNSQLGIIVRDGQRVPMTFLDWTLVDIAIKEGIWTEVQNNLLDAPAGYRKVCLATCNRLWRDHKTKTKKDYFEPNKDNPNLLLMVPPHVVPEQWHVLVAYWKSDVAQAISTQNSINREARGPLHVTGRKSLAQVRYDMEQSGEATDKMSVWVKARNQDDHDVIEAHMNYLELLDKEPEDQRQLTSVKDRIFHEVIGRDGHGHCRTYGSSVPPSLVYPHDPNLVRVSNSDLVQKISETVIEEVTKKLTEEVTKKLTEQFSILTRQWSLKYDEMMSQIEHLESNCERTTNPHALAPVDATSESSGHWSP